ncbi:transthyretin domain protein (hydroxyisourate hydrolase) [Phlyctema vagabunda]|uniref:5-hydroxyisourate hydrolase n=1 Tax=Phlyctema vagabunda TaxID=108571 RepID=A0ABR4PLT7_9HELO
MASTTTTTAAAATPRARDPITCHVLDTLTGRPAPRMIVTLSCLSHKSGAFCAVTNADGRVVNWEAESSGDGIAQSVEQVLRTTGAASSVWKLKFGTGAYYGEGKTFWPEVELTFYVKQGEHYHVPLLLGPYSYTTYRGS